MKFSDIVDQASERLQRTGRMSYRALKRDFDLDDATLDDLKEELIDIREVAIDKDGKMLVWTGAVAIPNAESRGLSAPQPPAAPMPNPESQISRLPVTYTPAHLADRIRAVAVTDGERKTITALFADLKGSTALIEGLDPEEARTVIDPALQLMMDAVHQYEGFVAQALGDGIFALFGAPLAHEDHPQRAVYAALRMQEAMRRYADTLRAKGSLPLLMRVGVNTGEVVVRSIRKDDLHTDYVPVGHSTNLAARMEQLANPGSIVVSAHTHRLTDGYFAFKDLGPTQIKGVEEPLHLYEVLGAGPLRTRLQVSARRGLTRFVGRRSELDQLQHALDHATAGHGQIVGVMGEPGVGKSRLFYEFKLTSLSGCLVLEALAVSHGKASPYLPIMELLKTYFHIAPTDEERLRKEKVTGRVLTLDRSLEDTLPYLFALLGLNDQNASLQQMDAQIRRQRTFEALKKLFLRESLNQPLVLIFEDLHWIDGETQGFLELLSESVASAKLLLLTNYRPEYRHEWGQKTYYTQLRLAPLGQAEAEELLTFLLGNDASLTRLKTLILERTEGTPFFIEEVVQTLMEEGVLVGQRGRYRLETTPTELHISPTVQGVLAARIDRLTTEEKALLQQLSVIGRQFPVSLVKHVLPQSEADLYRVLTSLQTKEFLYEQPALPESEYLFKHALTQEVAYGTVLHEQRKALHERTGQAMETLYKDNLDEHYSDLAYHYSRSEKVEKAIEYLQQAGQQASQRSANAEAVGNLTQALELLSSLPSSPQHIRQELELQIVLGSVLIATKGYAAPEVERAYARARTLCQQSDETLLSLTISGLAVFHLIRGDLETAKDLYDQNLLLAQRQHDPVALSLAHHGISACQTWQGEFKFARDHLEQALAYYDSRRDSQRRLFSREIYGQRVKSSCLIYMSFNLWLLGFPEQAAQKSQAAVLEAQALSHANSLAFSLGCAASVRQFRREAVMVRQQAEEMIAFAAAQGLPLFFAMATILQGWALAEQGKTTEGIAQLRRGMAEVQATGAGLMRPYWLALLVEAYKKEQRIDEGCGLLAEALTFVERGGEHWYEAELYRLKGELLLVQARQQATGNGQQVRVTDARSPAPDAQGEAEACFQKALAVSRQQDAKSWELRAATSLARIWQSQGKTAEARELLAPVYNWFTEGFDTKDLQEAKALLEKLQ